MMLQTKIVGLLLVVVAGASMTWISIDTHVLTSATEADTSNEVAFEAPIISNRTVGYYIRHKQEREEKLRLCNNDAAIGSTDAECHNAKNARKHLMLVPMEKLLTQYPE
jgi:hypothetical protein